MDNRTQQKGQELLKLRTIGRILTEGSPLLRNSANLWLYFPKTACPVFLCSLLKFLPLHICCFCSREFCQAFQVSIWCCSLLPKTLFRKTSVYGCTHNIGKHASQAIKEAAQNVLQAAAQSLSAMPWGRSSLHYPRAHRDHSAPKDLECRAVALCKAPYHPLHYMVSTSNTFFLSWKLTYNKTRHPWEMASGVASDQGSLH